MRDLPDLKAGIYRHYKGPLYEVEGYAHDANHDPVETGLEAALGQWEARWEALKDTLGPYVMSRVRPFGDSAEDFLRLLTYIERDKPVGTPVDPRSERFLVVYKALQLDGAHEGPRRAVRDVDDFLAWVWATTGERIPLSTEQDVANDALRRGVSLDFAMREGGCVPRFDYLGPQFLRGMMDDGR